MENTNSTLNKIELKEEKKDKVKVKEKKVNEVEFKNLVARDMGTTANILYIKNDYLYLANAGDSLAVIYKNGKAIKLNNEHKINLESEYKRVKNSGVKIINNRIEGRLNLTRAIGIY